MATTTRLAPDDRREQLLEIAVKHAVREGWNSLTRGAVANAAYVSPGLVSHYFDSTDNLRILVMQEAVSRELLGVLVEGIAARCPIACGAPVELRERALRSIK